MLKVKLRRDPIAFRTRRAAPSHMVGPEWCCCSLLARAIALGLQAMRERPGTYVETCVQAILVGGAEMDPSVKATDGGLFRGRREA